MIQFAISTMPARLEEAAKVKAQLPEGTRVYCDDPPSGGSWRNSRRALVDASKLAPEDWLVCVDDDVQLCTNFPVEAERALSMCPGPFATFYTSSLRGLEQVLLSKSSWLATLPSRPHC